MFSDRSNIRWLTGFTGSNGTLVVELTVRGAAAGGLAGGGVVGDAPDGVSAVLITDGRYAQQAAAELADAGCDGRVEVVIARSAETAAVERFGADAFRLLGLESTVSWGWQRCWDEAFQTAELVPLAETVEELRSVKDAAELARIGAAADIADQALSETQPLLRAGQTERSIQVALDDAMRRLGAVAPAFDTIVASGPNSALPHARPTERCLRDGDLVVVDMGAEVDGYRSDMTRTFLIGPAQSMSVSAPIRVGSAGIRAASKDAEVPALPDAAALLELVTRSQAAGVAAVRPGVKAAKVDSACRLPIAEAGQSANFVHSTGHGVGLGIHELPRVGPTAESLLRPGNVITVEPGVYVPGVGGVRVEDTLVVTDDGCRPITLSPKYRVPA